MNKKLIIISLLLIGLLFTQVPLRVQTQNPLQELPDAGLTPDSFFYFLDEWGEGIQEFFTFTDEGKAQLQVSLIGERVSEIEIMLGREVLNPRAIDFAFIRIESHTDRASVFLERLRARADTAPLSATLANETAAWEGFLNVVIKNSRGNLTVLADAERKILSQKMDDANFTQAMEANLTRIAEEIDIELGRPLTNFTVISYNRDVDDDTYSSTRRAVRQNVVNLTALRDRIFAQTGFWESGDAVLDNDSLDITFEKAYEPVTIDGIELFPQASVTISVTINSPRQGMTSINYDIDITLELKPESEQLADFLENLLDGAEEDLDGLSDKLEEQMDARSAARKAIREAEEEKQEIIDEAARKGITIPTVTFGAFDAFLAQARSSLSAGNYQESRRLAKRAEDALEKIDGMIVDNIIDELKEKAEEDPKRKMDNANFTRVMETHLIRIASEIDNEVGRPLEGFTVVYSSVDVDDDTYSSTHRAETATIVNLTALRDRILARTGNWKSGDVVIDNNSLYITFEKTYPTVTIDGIESTHEASVTINVTINRPRQGMTFINYDIDITMETESEQLVDFLENHLNKTEENLDGLSDQLENQTEAESAARRAIRETEEER